MLRSIPQLTDIRDRDLIARKVRLRRLEKSKRHESIPANQHVRDIVKKRIKFNYGGRQAIGVKIFFQDLARLALVSGLAVTVIGVGVSIFIWHTNNVSKNIIAQANPIVSVNQPMGVEQSISNTAPATSSPTAPQQSTLNNSPNQIIIPKIKKDFFTKD